MTKKLVEITWLDAESVEPGWLEEDFPEENIYLKTYGILIEKESQTYIYYGCTYDPARKTYSGVGKIPKGMVISIHEIMVIEYAEP